MNQSKMPFNDYVPPFKGMKSVTKQELIEAYGFSKFTFKRLFNKQFYPIFKELGYNKHNNLIPPIIVNKFIELYGEPF